MTDAGFWNGLSFEDRLELVEDALDGRPLVMTMKRSLANHHWDAIPERLIVQGVYIKAVLRPLVAETPPS